MNFCECAVIYICTEQFDFKIQISMVNILFNLNNFKQVSKYLQYSFLQMFVNGQWFVGREPLRA